MEVDVHSIDDYDGGGKLASLFFGLSLGKLVKVLLSVELDPRPLTRTNGSISRISVISNCSESELPYKRSTTVRVTVSTLGPCSHQPQTSSQ